MCRCLMIAALALVVLSANLAAAQSAPVIYPSRGQSPQQVDQDKYQCYEWARKQTGVDPMQASAPKQEHEGEILKGAAGGALLGLGVGAIAGDAGTGAAIGAGTGALFGGIRKQQKKEKRAEQSAAAINAYNRAFGACMEGRGYTVR